MAVPCEVRKKPVEGMAVKRRRERSLNTVGCHCEFKQDGIREVTIWLTVGRSLGTWLEQGHRWFDGGQVVMDYYSKWEAQRERQ